MSGVETRSNIAGIAEVGGIELNAPGLRFAPKRWKINSLGRLA